MRKILTIFAALLIYTTLQAQELFVDEVECIENKIFDLTPKNMINYLGKVNKEEFEKLVGQPVGEEDGFIVYEVNSKYEEIPIAIRCNYNEKTGKLIHVRFPTPKPLGYDLGMLHLVGNNKQYFKLYKNQFNNTYRVDYKYKGFGAQIFYSGIVIYHIVK
ncbi:MULTISPECIES: hypothetical protein [unclassified Dysgonomonas]|jgi:hypothetical protein|uniref:hypothetical protein n=1 Tax=unclassified Dysgonomonas TaxID=2630389 RepID=UPI0025BB8652|nr:MULTISPECIES: hypothetical protein [unclassified Dysgonomonas]MDR2003966.1 hypothetical protein [Prevotella sp.]HMM03996.1 hypothetical protein [Dysgonomonas sp.]